MRHTENTTGEFPRVVLPLNADALAATIHHLATIPTGHAWRDRLIAIKQSEAQALYVIATGDHHHAL